MPGRRWGLVGMTLMLVRFWPAISALSPGEAGELHPCNAFNSMEICDLKLNTSSFPAFLFTFSIITESLLTDYREERIVKWLEGDRDMSELRINARKIPAVFFFFLMAAATENVLIL